MRPLTDSDLQRSVGRIVAALDHREKVVFRRIGLRLLEGQVAYGPLAPGKKNWKKEAKEEAMDMAVYLSALLEDDEDENA